MNKRILISIVVLFSSLSNLAYADITESLSDKLFSKILNEERSLAIKLPKSYQLDKEKRYQVLYLLDGGENLSHTFGSLDSLNQNNYVPELIIVGIKNTVRMRDLTPTPRKAFEKSGGGEKFLDFIEFELIPYIDSHFRTTKFRILSGHSLGGLMAIHSLQSRPHLFQAHIALSPSLWWDKKKILNDTIEFFNARKKLNNILYMALGDEGPTMQKPFDELTNFLTSNNIKGFTFKSDFIESETHETLPIIGQQFAYRFLYKGWRIPWSLVRNTPPNEVLAAIKKHYSSLTNRLGEQAIPSTVFLNYLGSDYIRKEESTKIALEIFEYNAKLYPNMIKVYENFGDGFLGKGKVKRAVKQMEVLFSIMDENHQDYQFYQSFYKEVQKLHNKTPGPR